MSALVRFERPALTVSELLDDLFSDSFLAHPGREITGSAWPRVDIVEEEKEYRIQADIPGMKKDEIKVEVENGVLTISGEKREQRREERRDRYSYLERSFGSFRRSFSLPDNVDHTAIGAHYLDGVLELTLKKTEQSRPKAIEVKIG